LAQCALGQELCDTLVCAPHVLKGLTRHAGPRGARPVAHVVVDARSHTTVPLPLLASNLLDPIHADGALVNLWRIVPVAGQNPAGAWPLREAIATADTVATPTEDGRLQYGDSELRLLTEGDLSPAAVRAFNALMLKRSQRRELARETWRHVSGRRDVVPTEE